MQARPAQALCSRSSLIRWKGTSVCQPPLVGNGCKEKRCQSGMSSYLVALLWAVKTFSSYVQVRPFTLITDCFRCLCCRCLLLCYYVAACHSVRTVLFVSFCSSRSVLFVSFCSSRYVLFVSLCSVCLVLFCSSRPIMFVSFCFVRLVLFCSSCYVRLSLLRSLPVLLCPLPVTLCPLPVLLCSLLVLLCPSTVPLCRSVCPRCCVLTV